MWSRLAVLAVSAGGLASTGAALKTETQANPIRKVVTMLQAMQKKVEAEGVKEKELYDKFMCYCKSGNGDLMASITAAEDKIPQVTSAIEAAEGRLAQAKEDLKGAQEDRSAAKSAMAEATAVREKESSSFAAYKADADTNIAAMEKALAALERGMAGAGFLQTPTAQAIRKLAQGGSEELLGDTDRQDLLSFLSGTSAYSPQSGQISGILKQMHETMVKDLADASATEKASIETYEELMAAKSREVEALTQAIESKMKLIGELGVEIVQMKEDVDDTSAALSADKKFLAELETSCSTKTAEWEERSKTRSEELLALADTIRTLNDDDALELFKKTLPSPSSSFVQLAASRQSLRAQALAALRVARRSAGAGVGRPGLDFLVLALTGRTAAKGTFDKVIKMCDEMVAMLKREQEDDDHKKEYCAKQFDLSDDSKKALQRKISDHENAIATAKESIATLTEEIAALEKGIAELDKSVADATEQRKAENVEFKELIAADTAAKEVLEFAKNRLNKFYNPRLFKAPPKKELSAQGRIEASFAFIQVSRDAPAPPPETWGAYAKKSEEGTGVIAMIDLLVKDLDKEMTEAKTDEAESQKDYETMMKESAEKRATDSKSLTEKEGAKADTEAELQAQKEGKTAAGKELYANEKYIMSLHAECDWLLQYFDVRKEARTGEIDSIVKAKAVLSGSDYSFVQTRARSFLRGLAQ